MAVHQGHYMSETSVTSNFDDYSPAGNYAYYVESDELGYDSGYAQGLIDGVDNSAPTTAAITDEGELAETFEEATSTAIVVDLLDETEVRDGSGVFACFGDPSTSAKEPVFRRGAFEPGYAQNSTIVTNTTTQLRLSIRRDAGWPPGDVHIVIDPIDRGGNLDS